jgi:D-serine deaminase-like pyridoxal phosphate-dependent protein
LNKDNLVQKLIGLETQGFVKLVGLYSHTSLSYNNTTSAQAIESLVEEINGCIDALKKNRELSRDDKSLIISVGASPRVTAIQNLIDPNTPDEVAAAKSIRELSTEKFKCLKISLELHAGVYSVLDMQQLSTQSVDRRGSFCEEIALSVLVEVISIYNDGEREQPEAIIAAGTLALSRESCRSYPGWGIVGPKGHERLANAERRLIVERISQEHSVLSWDHTSTSHSELSSQIPLHVGDDIRIYPNHACVTGAMYKRYLVVDSTDASHVDRIVDVWERACGW